MPDRRTLRGLVLAAAWMAAAVLHAQPTAGGKLKVFISADMEGVGGVSTWSVQASSKGREYEKFRQLMTKEVNAAIAGAYDAGATEVVVADSHGDAQNLDIEALDKRVRLIRAWPRPLGMMQGIDASFGAVVFVGYHAAEGREAAVLSHTFSGTIALELDGVAEPEAGFNAAIAGDFGVPVVFLSGDQTICEDARKLLGPIETAAELKPYRVARPVKLKIRFNDSVNAEVVSYLPGVERPAGNVIVFTGRDMIEVSRFFQAVQNINRVAP